MYTFYWAMPKSKLRFLDMEPRQDKAGGTVSTTCHWTNSEEYTCRIKPHLPAFSQSFTQFTFLSVCRVSQQSHPPKFKGMNIIVNNGLSLAQTRYTSDQMALLFGIRLIPVISSKARLILERLFWHHHVKLTKKNLPAHLSLEMTLVSTRYGPLSFVTSNLRKIYGALI